MEMGMTEQQTKDAIYIMRRANIDLKGNVQFSFEFIKMVAESIESQVEQIRQMRNCGNCDQDIEDCLIMVNCVAQDYNGWQWDGQKGEEQK